MTAPANEIHSDEETPLLPIKQQQPKARTPLPWGQLWIVLVLQLSEPLTSQVIYPFTPQLIREIGITHGDEAKVGFYVGLLQSLFFATQALTVLHWSRISDHLGRKPVILTGLCGLSLSMYCFGLSRTFWSLVLSRCITGFLNGNIGVIKSMVAELTDATNIAQAYAYMPIAWSTGGTLGPIIGGSLSKPAERFPDVFGNSGFLRKYPYFLPCAIPASFSALAWLITFVFLKETVAHPKSISELLRIRRPKSELPDDLSDCSSVTTCETNAAKHRDDDEKPYPLRALLTRPVILAAGNYMFLSLVDIAIRAIQPLFYSTPIELGGLGLTPATIGNILSCYGVLNGIWQIFFFARIHDRWGTKRVFTAGILSAFPVFAMFPLINALARRQGLSGTVWLLVAAQVVISMVMNLSYGCVFIYISAASPNRASLGATNGLAQMGVSIMRTIGPAAANSLFSISIKENILNGGLVYVVLIAVAFVAVLVAALLPRQIWRS